MPHRTISFADCVTGVGSDGSSSSAASRRHAPRIKYGLAPGCLGGARDSSPSTSSCWLRLQSTWRSTSSRRSRRSSSCGPSPASPSLLYAAVSSTGNAFAETPTAGMFALGAVPTTALVYPLSHGLPMLAGAAVLGGFGFRPLVRALDGKPLPTLPLSKKVDTTPSVGPHLRRARRLPHHRYSCRTARQDHPTLGVGQLGLNLLDGLTPNTATSPQPPRAPHSSGKTMWSRAETIATASVLVAVVAAVAAWWGAWFSNRPEKCSRTSPLSDSTRQAATSRRAPL